MFRTAYATASQFTWPVVLSRRTVGGKCSSSIGSCTIINDEGWMLTCAHIVDAFEKMVKEAELVRDTRAQMAAIKADASLSAKQLSNKLGALPKITQDMTENCSAWWGRDGV